MWKELLAGYWLIAGLAAVRLLHKIHKKTAKLKKKDPEGEKGLEAVTYKQYDTTFKVHVSYLVAFFLGPWRWICVPWVLVTAVGGWFTCIGADMDKELPAWRRKMLKLNLFLCIWIMTRFHMFCPVFERKPDVDYEEWLGPDWRKEVKKHKNKRIPTIVTNHSSYLDIWLLLSSFWIPAFLAKWQIRATIVGY